MSTILAPTAVQTVSSFGASLVGALPRLGGALLTAVAAIAAGRVIRWTVLRAVRPRPGHESLRLAIGRLASAAVIAVGALIAATIAFPSFTVGGLIQLLGVSGIVVGFAFKDIFQNFLAGILILITRPFTIGDQIVVDSFEGTVEEIQTRATLIRTFDRRRVVVPNADLFTKAVTVSTAFRQRRTEYDLVLAGDVDLAAVKRRIVETLRGGIEGVAADPVADVVLLKVAADGGVTLRLRWFNSSDRGEHLVVQDRVLERVRDALRENPVTAATRPAAA